MADLETLSIKIMANANQAYDAIDKLSASFTNLSSSLAKIEAGKINDVSFGLDNLSKVMNSLNATLANVNYDAAIKGIKDIQSIKPDKFNILATTLNGLAGAMSSISAAAPAAENISYFVSAIGQLSNKSMANAITNIPILEDAIAKLVNRFSKLPTINQSIIEFIDSLANLAAKGQSVSTAIKGVENSLGTFGATTVKAVRKAQSLESIIGKLYAKFWLLMRGARAFKNSFISAADYLEAFNYFDVTARKIGADSFAKAGVGDAEEYAQAFMDTMQEKLHKMSGLELDLEDRLIKTTNAKSLGLNLTELTQYQASIASITNAMGNSQEIAQSTAKAFSMLAGDMGSLKNLDFDQVAQNLQSALTGQARALYKYGIDLTEASLEQYAFANGVTKSVSEMSQAEKAQLRLLAILDQSKVAWGDLANTINSPSNQLRMLQNNLKEVGITFGQLFIPVLSSALPVINGVSMAIKQLLVDIAELLGIELKLDSFGQLGDEIDADIESVDELNKSIQETKKGIRDFDELKVINDSKNKGAGTGNVIDLTSEIIAATSEYEKVWDEAYQRMTSKASEIAGYISQAFEPIKTIIEDFHIGDFFKAGEDVSKLVISIFDFISDAIDEVDWEKLGNKIGDFLKGLNWTEILKSLGGLIATAVQSALDLWWGSFTAAPFETAIITAFAIMKFTGLGDKILGQLSKQISSTLGGKKGAEALKNKLAGLGAGLISVGLGVALTVDNIQGVSEGDYNVGDLQFWLKSIVSSLFTGAGISLAASAIGIASGGLAFGIGAAVSLLANVIVGVAEMETSYESVSKVLAAESAWIDEHNLDSMEILTNIELKGELTKESFDNIDKLTEKVIYLSNNYETLTSTQKAELKRYSDELVAAVPGIVDQIDKITGAYTGTSEELQKVIDKEKERIKLESYWDNLKEISAAKDRAEKDIEDIKTEKAKYDTGEERLRKLLADYYGEEIGNSKYDKIADLVRNEGWDITTAMGNVLTGGGYTDFVRFAALWSKTLSGQDTYNKKLEETQEVLDNLSEQYDYWDAKINEQYTETIKNAELTTQETLDNAKKIIDSHKLPSAVEKAMAKVDDQIKHGDTVSTANMNKMFNSINNAFEGLEDGKPPAEIQSMLDNIKDAIINNSPELELLMAQLAIKMENAFSNALQTDDGHLLWNKNGISKRLDNDFNSVEDAIHNNAKPGTKTLEKDLLELFGVTELDRLPKNVKTALDKVADTINKGEGRQSVLDALKSLKTVTKNEAEQLGMYLQWGLAGGIYDGTHVVEAAVYDGMVEPSIEKAEDGYEEKSPSKVFERIGKYLPMGAAIGIKEGIPDLKLAIASMVEVTKSMFSGLQYNIPDLGLNYTGSQNGFNYGNMDNNNSFVSQLVNMANTANQNGQTEVVFRIEGDPYGMFKIIREENDKYKRQHSNKSAFT